MIAELRDGRIKGYEIRPEDVGLNMCRMEDLKGNDPEENARITEEILEGKGGAKRDIVLLNASAAIVAGGKADTLKEGLVAAAESIGSGAALEKLRALREFTK